ncbi:hypothetical protein HDU98_003218 [Podochytrium sp. JEL0797]|nr:hypothetical protein HDU98_003218 [Podochytrium sp. JEL0797]
MTPSPRLVSRLLGATSSSVAPLFPATPKLAPTPPPRFAAKKSEQNRATAAGPTKPLHPPPLSDTSSTDSQANPPTFDPPPTDPSIHAFRTKNPIFNQLFLSKYEMVAELGVGGFGFVCAARRKEDKKDVAVKFIMKHRVMKWFEDDVWGRIPMEVYVLKSISNESIVSFIEYFEDHKFCYLVMELFGTTWQKVSPDSTIPQSSTTTNPSLIPHVSTLTDSTLSKSGGGHNATSPTRTFSSHHTQAKTPITLTQHRDPREFHLSGMVRALTNPAVRPKHPFQSTDLFDCIEHTRFDNTLARHVFKQIMQAVHHLHSLNISHRDLKDENIVIDDTFRVKLIDFGSAVVEDENVEEGKFVYRDRFQGTVQFAPPEVLSGFRYRTKPADIWACGILLYTILCGETPFSASNQVVSEHFKPPRYECVPDVVDLLSLMLCKDPKTRPTSQQVLDHVWFTDAEEVVAV